MPNTYTQLYIHIVFAVYGRDNAIKAEWKEELHKYITGIVRERKQKLIAINSMPDHVHVLIGYNPTIPLPDLVGAMKASSTNFINTHHPRRVKFRWQEGYGAFSHSRSNLDEVIRYIAEQERHHAKRTFKQEYLGFLKNYEVDYNEKYLFEFYEEAPVAS